MLLYCPPLAAKPQCCWRRRARGRTACCGSCPTGAHRGQAPCDVGRGGVVLDFMHSPLTAPARWAASSHPAGCQGGTRCRGKHGEREGARRSWPALECACCLSPSTQPASTTHAAPSLPCQGTDWTQPPPKHMWVSGLDSQPAPCATCALPPQGLPPRRLPPCCPAPHPAAHLGVLPQADGRRCGHGGPRRPQRSIWRCGASLPGKRARQAAELADAPAGSLPGPLWSRVSTGRAPGCHLQARCATHSPALLLRFNRRGTSTRSLRATRPSTGRP